MSLFDFNKLNRPTSGTKDVNPLDIFRKAPALSGTPNDLWQGQSRALEAWHSSRTKNDVLISLHSHQAILLELKTKKYEAGINMGDVGQGFNHYQATMGALKDSRIVGLIFVCPNKTCTREAAPSPDMWVEDLAAFRRLYDETNQMLLAMQRLEPQQRYGEIEALSQRAEWQPAAIFERIRGTRLVDLK